VSPALTVSNTTVGSNGPVCEGGTLNLTATGGVTYSWTGPNGFTSTAQNPVLNNVTTAMSGNYIVTISGGSCSITRNVSVNISAAPTMLTTSISNSTPVCEGGTINFTASGGTSYAWSGPNGWSSTLQNPSIAGATMARNGTYTVIITNASGCSITRTTDVTVNAAPTMLTTSISNSTPVCEGGAINFTASGGTSYAWSGPNGWSSTLQNPSIAGATMARNGTYSVIITNANGCAITRTTDVVVNAGLNAGNTSITSNSPVCAGGVINLSATGGTSYAWSGPNGWSASGANATINAATAANNGTYFVQISNATCTFTQSITVVVNPNAIAGVVSTNQSVCSGNTPAAALTLSGQSGTIVRWERSTSSNFSSSVTNIANTTSSLSAATIGALTTTTYFRAVVSGCNGEVYSTIASITVNPNAVGGTVSANQTICSGTQPAALTLSGNVGSVIRWERANNNAFTTGLTSIASTSATLSGATIGSLTATRYFRAVVNNGCGGNVYSSTVTITVSAATVAGTVSSDQTICSGTQPAALTLTGYTGTIVRWERANNSAFTTGLTTINVTSATLSSANMGALTATRYFRAVVNGCGGNVNSSSVVITVNTAAVGGTVSSSQTICSGNTPSSLALSGYTGTIVRWERSTSSNFSSNVTQINNTTSTLNAASIGALTATTYFRAVVTGCGGNVNSSAATITVTPAAVGGTALVNGVVSANTCYGSAVTVSLVGQTGSVTRWEYSVSAGSWQTINSTSTTIIRTITQTTSFRAIVAVNSSCAPVTSSTATVAGSFIGVAGVVTATSTSVCTGSSVTFSLTGNSGRIVRWEFSRNGGLSWVTVPGTATSITYSGATENRRYRAVVRGCINNNIYSNYVAISVAPCANTRTTDLITKAPEQAPVILSDKLEATAYPNPSDAYFSLQVKSPNKDDVEIKVFDIGGKQVAQMKGAAIETYRFGQNFVAGTYIVEIRQGNERITRKIIKQ